MCAPRIVIQEPLPPGTTFALLQFSEESQRKVMTVSTSPQVVPCSQSLASTKNELGTPGQGGSGVL